MINSKNNMKHEILDDGTERWVLPNKRVHQDNDVPALISPNGTEVYHKNGTLFRELGPTIKHPDGYEFWSTNEKYFWHRKDGAARVNADGERIYQINGKIVTYDKFRKQNKTRNPR